jgi:hypothetical protein
MATLVLTAVGGALGGPVGAALGALVGQSVDHGVLFRPKGREGPRLTELRIQTSSYGTAIPQLFGRMRVAGTVIWSTDLIGRSTTRAGKGQPSVTHYNYSASFAVLLSARAVLDIGRVWADGQLIRGAAGDWKVKTGFRLHTGAEDQAADPLIASAEGVGLTPAHRGFAYAVFEDMALESFGNRLPSLTFEVIADVEPVGVGAIAATLAHEVTGAPALRLDGFAASGGSVGAVLETLAAASGAWFAPAGAGLVMRDDGAVAGTVAERDGREGSREVAAADAAPGVVTVSHHDPQRDWQARPAAGAAPRRGPHDIASGGAGGDLGGHGEGDRGGGARARGGGTGAADLACRPGGADARAGGGDRGCGGDRDLAGGRGGAGGHGDVADAVAAGRFGARGEREFRADAAAAGPGGGTDAAARRRAAGAR